MAVKLHLPSYSNNMRSESSCRHSTEVPLCPILGQLLETAYNLDDLWIDALPDR